jgi:hypothetical protein
LPADGWNAHDVKKDSKETAGNKRDFLRENSRFPIETDRPPTANLIAGANSGMGFD